MYEQNKAVMYDSLGSGPCTITSTKSPILLEELLSRVYSQLFEIEDVASSLGNSISRIHQFPPKDRAPEKDNFQDKEPVSVVENLERVYLRLITLGSHLREYRNHLNSLV